MSRFKDRLGKLLNNAALGIYLEPERKLDAQKEETLQDVENYIFTDLYFNRLNEDKITCDIPSGIDIPSLMINHYSPEPAHQVTPRRFRVYYDTPFLRGMKHGVEVRIEHPGPTEHGHKKPYKQVVKIGGPASPEDPTFHRIEIAGRLAKSIPEFSEEVLDGSRRISTFLRSDLKATTLRPLQVLITVRTRIWCMPQDYPGSVVEFGIDRGNGITVDGYQYPILQIEPELMQGGNPAALEAVTSKLKDKFKDALSYNYTSKPTPGFNHLAGVLDKRGRIHDHKLADLPLDRFGLISAPQSQP